MKRIGTSHGPSLYLLFLFHFSFVTFLFFLIFSIKEREQACMSRGVGAQREGEGDS